MRAADDRRSTGLFVSLFVVTSVVSGRLLFALFDRLLAPDCDPSPWELSSCGVNEWLATLGLSLAGAMLAASIVVIGAVAYERKHPPATPSGDSSLEVNQFI